MSSLPREIRTGESSSSPLTRSPSCPPSPGRSGQVSPPWTLMSEHAAIVIRILHMLEAVLPCRIFMQYQRRCSTDEAKLVDRLSRASTTTQADYDQLRHLHIQTPKGPFITWLSKKCRDILYRCWTAEGKGCAMMNVTYGK
jgi:hypothetical protein